MFRTINEKLEQRDPSVSIGSEAQVRASNPERERVVDLLSRHAADGRLGLEELEVRIDRAYAARTRGELAALTADLPAVDEPDHRGTAPAARSLPRLAQSALRGQLAAFLVVNLVLVAVWALTGAGYFWPIWPILGWGLGLIGPGPCGRGRRHRHIAVCRTPRHPAHLSGW